jgi:hypothetical protein
LLACWPPGPPDGPNRHCNSESGMSNRINRSLFSGLETCLTPVWNPGYATLGGEGVESAGSVGCCDEEEGDVVVSLL